MGLTIIIYLFLYLVSIAYLTKYDEVIKDGIDEQIPHLAGPFTTVMIYLLMSLPLSGIQFMVFDAYIYVKGKYYNVKFQYTLWKYSKRSGIVGDAVRQAIKEAKEQNN